MDPEKEYLGEVLLGHGGKVEDHGGIVVEKLLDDVAAGRATVGFAIYAPGASTGKEAVTHPGTEFLILLEGSLVAEVDGKGYRLEPGDTIRFQSTRPHRGWNPGNITSRALFVNYRPQAD